MWGINNESWCQIKRKIEKLVGKYMSGINNESWCQIKLKIEKLVGKYMWGINNEYCDRLLNIQLSFFFFLNRVIPPFIRLPFLQFKTGAL